MSEKHYLQYQTDPTVSYIMSRDKKKWSILQKNLNIGAIGTHFAKNWLYRNSPSICSHIPLFYRVLTLSQNVRKTQSLHSETDMF